MINRIMCDLALRKKNNLQNYDIIRKDRREETGEGLTIYIRKTLGTKVNYRNKWLNILIIHTPSNNVNKIIIMYHTEQVNKPKLIMGDF